MSTKKTFKKPVILKVGYWYYLLESPAALTAMRALENAIEIDVRYHHKTDIIIIKRDQRPLSIEQVKRGTKITLEKDTPSDPDEEVLELENTPLALPHKH